MKAQKPQLSTLFHSRKPSAIRLAQIEFAKRRDGTDAVNTAIGNVSLPMHPSMIARMDSLREKGSLFEEGVVRYSATVGLDEAREAFKHIIAASNYDISKLEVQITDGGSHGMELVILGTCGGPGKDERPLLVIDPAYANYISMANRTGRSIITVRRELEEDGTFSLPDFAQIENIIEKKQPGALLIIPYDNPTGQFFNQETINKFAQLAVKHNLWLISDESYRELNYTGEPASSVWGITEKAVPGITGRRISLETASKVWNACGLRIGALVTDNKEFLERSVAENTANLCPPVVAQYIFASLKDVPEEELQAWFAKQRDYYAPILRSLREGLGQKVPGIIVSAPDASLYAVVDVRRLVGESFDALDFVLYCAREGSVTIDGKEYTLLVSPMAGFYNTEEGEENPGRTQMRIALVETPERMQLVPELFSSLLQQYLG